MKRTKKMLKITLGGKDFMADLCAQEAPQTVAAFEAAGPFTSFIFAANICSNEVTWNTPVEELDVLENKVFYEDPGNIVFYPPWGCICAFFGPTEPAGWCTKFAKVVDADLPGFIAEADKVWHTQGGSVTTAIVEVECDDEAETECGCAAGSECAAATECATAEAAGAEPASMTAENAALIAKIAEATQSIWTERPEDVDRMIGRNYETGKEFSVWAYSWGYLSNLGDLMYEYFQVGNAGEGDLETLKFLAARQCRRYSGSFEHSAHMSDTYTLLLEAAEGFERVGSHAEFAKLARTLQRFVMQMSFWVDIELPWAEVSVFIDNRWHGKA